MISEGSAEHVKSSIFGNHGMSGTHVINDGGAGTVASESFADSETTYMQEYRGSVTAGTQYEHCYRAALEASCPRYSNGVQSTMVCAPPQQPPPPREPITLCDDGSNTGQCSPIIINFGSGTYTLSGSNDPVLFDIDADGVTNRITWTAVGSRLAFLAFDRNQNGMIDNGSELFGDSTRLLSGVRATHGFHALNELDTNGDGLVSALDRDWPSLLVWTDLNHDGISQRTEIQKARESALSSITTTCHWTGRRDRHGNLFRYQGTAIVGGHHEPVYDVFFRTIVETPSED
ncbi:MAG TPA: hypothetical protein VF883_01205 [Thermoanaerobaculia bacterium]|jgi:hypothetical protein